MNLKKMVGIEAAKYVQDDMIVGLGTGSTAYYLVEELGRRIKEEGLQIIGVTTSRETEEQARNLGIPLRSIDEVAQVDITIDGADEISADFQGIKGGGAALLFEKIVGVYSEQVIWIVDHSKMVEKLGRFPLPIEVVPYGSQHLLQHFEDKGYRPKLREDAEGNLQRTDSENYIIDLQLEVIEDPHQLAAELDGLVGVVEHGLFLDMVDTVIVGHEHGIETLLNTKN